MDRLKNEEIHMILRWQQRRHNIAALVTSIAVYWFMRRKQRNYVEIERHSARTSSKGKRKRDSLDEMIEALKIATAALKKENDLFEKFYLSKKNLYEKFNQKEKYEEIYNGLVAIGIEEHAIVDAYIFLTNHNHPDRMTQFLGCPFTDRKRLLEKLMSDDSKR